MAMPDIDMNDLSNVAKIKSKIMSIYWQLIQENLCTKEEAAQDLEFVISDIIELENNLQTKITSK